MQLKKKMAAVLAGGLMLTSLGTVAAVAQPGDHKTTICHRTGVNSMNNKFVLINVDDSALPAHIGPNRGHDGDVLPTNGKCPGDDDTPPDGKDVVICHRTDDDEPFEKIVVQEGPELQAHLDHGDELPDPDTGECPPVEDDGDEDDDGDCSNESTGLNLLQSINLAVPISLINVGENEQTAVTSCGDDGDASNQSTGINLVQLINTAIPISGLNIGENTQHAVTP